MKTKGFVWLVITFFIGCNSEKFEFKSSLLIDKEYIGEGNDIYSPTTQSIGRHSGNWMRTLDSVFSTLSLQEENDFYFMGKDSSKYLTFKNVPLEFLLPGLHYDSIYGDSFDAFNLMMAEYSRNGIHFPYGVKGDAMTHFETNIEEGEAWSLISDYKFQPKKYVRPLRMGLVNNCLAPGFWEISATDRTGELYHSWFYFDLELYQKLLANLNNMSPTTVSEILTSNHESTVLKLERLREIKQRVASHSVIRKSDELISYSTQSARRKLSKQFVQVYKGYQWRTPVFTDELVQHPVRFSKFVEPGVYHVKEFEEFDFTFLQMLDSVRVGIVEPKTKYRSILFSRNQNTSSKTEYLEFVLYFGEYQIVIGNVPMKYLVTSEDFVIHGFGVGIHESNSASEARRLLVQNGPLPSYAYLCKKENNVIKALNSHKFGLEQIVLRRYQEGREQGWFVTLTSYERIVDIVKFKIPLATSERKVWELNQKYDREYSSPLWRIYQDDNLK